MTIEIALPYWGDPALLRETVASVLAQTDQDWRLRVIDDAYPDESVPAFFAALDDPRISYHRNPENVGIAANFARAVDDATEAHLVILGSDDLLLPGYVAAVRAAFQRHPEAAIVQPGVEVIDEHGAPSLPLADRIKQRMLRPNTGRGDVLLAGEPLAASLLAGNWLYWPSLCFRTEAIKAQQFRMDLPVILDLAIILDIVFAGGELVVLDETAFAYRRHSASASQQSILDGTRFADDRRFFAEAADRAAARGWKRAARAARWRTMSRLHAITAAPEILRRGTREGRRSLLHHVLG